MKKKMPTSVSEMLIVESRKIRNHYHGLCTTANTHDERSNGLCPINISDGWLLEETEQASEQDRMKVYLLAVAQSQ